MPRGPRIARLARLVCSLTILGACTDSAGTTGPSPDRGIPSRGIGETPLAAASLDEEFAALADSLPGFAGWYFADDGDAVVMFTGTAPTGRAWTQLASLIALRSAELARSAPVSGTRRNGIIVRRADYSFRALHTWHLTLDSVLAELGGPAITDVSESSNRIAVSAPLWQQKILATTLSSLGIPTMAVVFEPPTDVLVSRSDTRLHRNPFSFTYNFAITDTVRPVVGGLQATSVFQAGTYTGCTLSFNLNFGGAAFVTNSHCTSEYGLTAGTTAFFQPYYLSEQIGQEVADTALFWPSLDCPPAYLCRWSDAAISRYGTSASWSLGYIARTTYLGYPHNVAGSTLLDTGNPRFEIIQKEPNTALVQGTPFYRVGRTSGWTYHTIFTTCFTFLGSIPNLSGGNRAVKLWCQYTASGQSLPGDSGGPMFRLRDCAAGQPTRSDGTNCVGLMGINWGNQTPPNPGRAVWSPISGVERDFGVSLKVKASDWP